MKTLNTERLRIYPLSAAQLRLWLEDIPALGRELGCRYDAEPVEGVFADIVRGQLDITERDAANAVWHTFWFIERLDDRVVVGSADFKAPPSAEGEVEIGYGLGESHRGRGYMTETVGAMCRWALAQPGVRAVIAETERDTPEAEASQRLLSRCGFKLYKEGETLWWRLDKQI